MTAPAPPALPALGVPAISELDWLERLIARHDLHITRLVELDRYYEGCQPLSYMHPELLREIGERIRQVVINWPRLIIDTIEHRLDVEGFRAAGAARDDARLWEIWQGNDLDEHSQAAQLDALVMGRAYVIVGRGDEGGMPLITCESPLEVFHDLDPRTRRVRAAVKRWTDEFASGGPVLEFATLYLPTATVHFQREPNAATAWTQIDRDDHQLGDVPVVPLLNRGRTLSRLGVSELADVLPISDAACKIATDMMIGAEYHALPRRAVFGMKREDFKNPDGTQAGTWSALTGRLWATPNANAKAMQFAESDLSNFHRTINALAQLVASLSGLPAHYLGFVADNPASADAIRSSEAGLVKRAERKARAWGGTWEQVMRLALRAIGEVPGSELRRLETRWRDPATPTYAQKADAVTKLVAAGIIPPSQAQEDLGYTTTQRDNFPPAQPVRDGGQGGGEPQAEPRDEAA